MGPRLRAAGAVNPGLDHAAALRFRADRPYRDRPGFGAIGESMGGMRYVTGYPDRPPVRLELSIGDAIARCTA